MSILLVNRKIIFPSERSKGALSFGNASFFYFLKDLVTDMGRNTKAKSMSIPRLKKLESNSSWMNFIPDDERIVLLTIESHIGEEIGMMNICIPNVFIKELLRLKILTE